MKDLAVFLCWYAAALVFYFLLVRLLAGVKKSGHEAGPNFIQRVSLPAVFLVASYLAWKVRVGKLVLTSERFSAYAEAAVLLFSIFLVVRFFDAWLIFRKERKNLPRALPRVLHSFLLFVVYLTVLLVVLKSKLGINISVLLTTSAIFTAIIGLAFQGVLGNLLAGISLNLTRSLSRGDWVSIKGTEGVVKEMNWRETHILDRAGNLVIIPNNVVASEMLVNFSRPTNQSLVAIPVKVSPEVPPAVVLEAMKQAAAEVPGVLSPPAPDAFIQNFENTGVTYLLRFWVDDFSRKNIIAGEVARHVWYRFKRLGVEFSLPVGEFVDRLSGTIRPEIWQEKEKSLAEKNFKCLAESRLLRKVEGSEAGSLLVPEEELKRLAARVQRHLFTAGEILFRQGEKGNSCYIVARGKIKGEIVYEEGGKRFVSEFETGPGGVVGEMSLFTGLPRTATCRAVEESELLEITQEDFVFLLERNQGVAEVLAVMVSERNKQNEEFLKKIKELSEKDIAEVTDKGSILRRFLRLIGVRG